ncbi:MAG: hypothetical protein PHI12_12705 [Dehalococcoidales bacterium]|nr:hypothetical protein [Dehalococcoidales bacterium]
MPSYLRIDGITAYPNPAEEGDWVALSIQVTNISSQGVYGNVHGAYNGVPIPRGGDYIVEAGATRMFYRSFYMPSASVTGTITVSYMFDAGGGAIGYWADDTKEFTVDLLGAPEQYDGRIENIRIKWGSSAFPASLYSAIPQEIPYGNYFRIGFTGRNLSDVNLTLWGSVKVYRPNGSLFYQDQDVETGYTGPGGTHNFEFPQPTSAARQVDAYGVWKATIELRASSSSGELLDYKTQVVIFSTPEEEPPPGAGYDGEIRYPQICQCSGTWQSLEDGIAQIPAGNTIEVKFDGRNLCGCYAAMHGWVTVKSPSGVTAFSDYDDNTVIRADGTDHHFKFPVLGCSAQELTALGEHTVEIILKAEHDGVEQEVDRKSYTFNVVEGEEPPSGEPSDLNGYIEQVYVDWTNLASGELPVPISGAPLGENFRISYHATIIETILHTQTTKGYVWLYGPDGSVKYEDSDSVLPSGYIWALSFGAWYHPFVFPSVPSAWPLDEQGEWTYKVRFEDSQGKVIDEREGVLFSSVAEQATSSWGIIAEMMPLMMIMMMFGMMVPMMRDVSGELEAGHE